MILVYEFSAGNFSTFFGGAKVDMDFGARAAGAGVTHFPEVIVLVAVDDMVGRKVLEPYLLCLVVAFETFGGRAFEYGCVEV